MAIRVHPLALAMCVALGMADKAAALAPLPIAPDPMAAAMRRIADTYAGSTIAQGKAAGVSIGITYKGKHYLYAYGLADADGTPSTTDGIYEMGSVTKIFTTAMLGQNVVAGTNSLTQTLGDFDAQIGYGRLHPSTRMVTLENLGDFTAGLPSLPSICGLDVQPKCGDAAQAPVTSCIPNGRPTIEEYGAANFTSYYRWYTAPAMPSSYCYSDISTGLIGLLIAAPPNKPLGANALGDWFDLVKTRILKPLDLRDTFLDDALASDSQAARLAVGYTTTEAAVIVGDHVVKEINVTAMGGRYKSVPPVTIVGGGGTGAKATAKLNRNGFVESIVVDDGGQGYEAIPEVVFSGGSPTVAAKGVAVVKNGQVIGVSVFSGGAGYVDTDVVTATVQYGQEGPLARPAVLGRVAIGNGAVTWVQVVDGGAGYFDPITVLMPLADGVPPNVVPIWGAAGSLKSSTGDMLKLADVVLGHVDGDYAAEKQWLYDGFKVATQPYACEGASATCTYGFSGLAWDVSAGGYGQPVILTKNGGLTGFSTEFRVVPERDLGVIVFVNSRPNADTTVKPLPLSVLISDNVMHTILQTMP